MSSPIVEILSGAATYVLHVSGGPQRPHSENDTSARPQTGFVMETCCGTLVAKFCL